jgi:hypothetical protein
MPRAAHEEYIVPGPASASGRISRVSWDRSELRPPAVIRCQQDTWQADELRRIFCYVMTIPRVESELVVLICQALQVD